MIPTSVVVLEFPQVEQVRRGRAVIASHWVHRDGLSCCLSYGLCKGGDGMVKFGSVLDNWV